jgi:hypothetical protein
MTQSQSFEEIANDWVGRRQRIATEFRISIKDVDYWAEVVEREGKGTWPPIEPGVWNAMGDAREGRLVYTETADR